MAVLFMPMVAARAAGVLYTRDPARPRAGNGCWSVRYAAWPRTSSAAWSTPRRPASPGRPSRSKSVSLPRGDTAGRRRSSPTTSSRASGVSVSTARRSSMGLSTWSGRSRTPDGRASCRHAPWPQRGASGGTAGKPSSSCLARGGLTIVGGRAAGVVAVAETPAQGARAPRGRDPRGPPGPPELGHLLPKVDGLVAEHGSLAGHLASLAREFGVPSVFGMPDATRRLAGEPTVSLNATHCEVYRGEAWPPEEREDSPPGAGAAFRGPQPAAPAHSAPRSHGPADPAHSGRRAAAPSTTSCACVTSGGWRRSSRRASGATGAARAGARRLTGRAAPGRRVGPRRGRWTGLR